MRVAAFYVLVDLLRLLDELKRRVDSGQRCRLVVVKRSDESGRFSTEIAIELKQ
ncbi:Hypothetical protein A7982_03877 [Minicystis rosea]|nr:Hypothetical protein A7982_03877 [Minicystis rosea]